MPDNIILSYGDRSCLFRMEQITEEDNNDNGSETPTTSHLSGNAKFVEPRFNLFRCCCSCEGSKKALDPTREEILVEHLSPSEPPHEEAEKEVTQELFTAIKSLSRFSTKRSETPLRNKSVRFKKGSGSPAHSLDARELSPLTTASTCDDSAQGHSPQGHSPLERSEDSQDNAVSSEPSTPVSQTPMSQTPMSQTPVSQTPVSQTPMSQVTPAIVESKQSSSLPLPPGSIPSSRRWVVPTPIHLAVKQQELEGLLTTVQQLTKDEYLLEAHSEYLKLLVLLDTILVDNKLQVFGLIRPPFFLRRQHESAKDPEPQDLEDNPGVKKRESSWKHVRVNTNEFSRMWGTSPTFTRPHTQIASTDWHTQRSWLLSREMSKRLEGAEPQHKKMKPPKRGLSGLQGAAENFAPSGTAILEEPVKVLPLKSQQLDQFEGEQEEHSLTVEGVLESFSGAADSKLSKGYLGRRLLHKRVWPLGDLPCFAFTVRNNESDNVSSAQLKTLLTEQDNSELLQGKDALDVILKDSFGYTYESRAVGGLSLPTDIQVIFMAATTSPSTDHSHDVAPRDASPRSDGTPRDGSDKMQKDGAEGVADGKAQLWKWFHSFLERIVNNPQIHRMRKVTPNRIQHYQSQRALTVLSADFTNDKSWTSSHTKDHRLAWKVLKDGNALCVIEGILNTPLFECLSLLNESDLHQNWMPFLSESLKDYQIATFSQVIRQRSALFWPLDDRESLLFAYAMDLMSLTPASVVLNGLSIPDSATSFFGLSVSPPKPGLTRLQAKLFTFQLKPIPGDPLKTGLKQIIYLDPQMAFIPKSAQGFIAKQTATRLFGSIQLLSKTFKGSIYATRVRENPRVYGIVQTRLDAYYKSLLPDDSSTSGSPEPKEEEQ